jgi:hypothetical protein
MMTLQVIRHRLLPPQGRTRLGERWNLLDTQRRQTSEIYQ